MNFYYCVNSYFRHSGFNIKSFSETKFLLSWSIILVGRQIINTLIKTQIMSGSELCGGKRTSIRGGNRAVVDKVVGEVPSSKGTSEQGPRPVKRDLWLTQRGVLEKWDTAWVGWGSAWLGYSEERLRRQRGQCDGCGPDLTAW